MIAILASVFPVFAMILIGWVAGMRRWLPNGAVDALNAFVVRLALPVLLFQFVAEADWRTLWHPAFALALAGGIAIVFAGTFLLAPRGSGTAVRSVEALAGAYANTAFMGIPIGQAVYGTIGLAAAVIASLLTVCITFAFSILLVGADLHRGRGIAHAGTRVLVSLARNPLVLGPIAGAAWALSGLALPGPVHHLASLLGAAASPVALVTIGLFLGTAPADAAAGRIEPLVAMKLVAHPLATLALVRLFGVPHEWAAPAVLIAALPTGTGPFMLAKLYDLEPASVARTILITTMLSAATVPLVALLLG